MRIRTYLTPVLAAGAAAVAIGAAPIAAADPAPAQPATVASASAVPAGWGHGGGYHGGGWRGERGWRRDRRSTFGVAGSAASSVIGCEGDVQCRRAAQRGADLTGRGGALSFSGIE